MRPQDTFVLHDEWPAALSLLPQGSDLEESARRTGALVRKRQVRDAQTLLRLTLAYSYTDLSLRQVSAWAEQTGLAKLSDVAVYKRLRAASEWMSCLVSQVLAARGVGCRLSETASACLRAAERTDGRRVRIVDASVVCAPGAKGVGWRVHMDLRLAPLVVEAVQVTDAHGGERLSRFACQFERGDIVLGDRGYAHRAGLWSVVKAGADVAVRLPWSNVPLQDEDGQALEVVDEVHARLKDAEPGSACDFAVQTAPAPGSGPEGEDIPAIPGRVVAVRKSPEAAERARREARKTASKKGRQPDERTLLACDYVFVFTTLPAEVFTAEDVLGLYRLRWQVELCFKRLKGIIGLDHLRAKEPDLCRTYLLGNLLAALLAEGLAHGWLGFSPGGVDVPGPRLPGLCGLPGEPVVLAGV